MLELEGYPIYGGGFPQVTNPGKPVSYTHLEAAKARMEATDGSK